MKEWENIRNECVNRLMECDGPADVEKTLMVLWVGWFAGCPKVRREMLSGVEEKMKADAIDFSEELDRKNKE